MKTLFIVTLSFFRFTVVGAITAKNVESCGYAYG